MALGAALTLWLKIGPETIEITHSANCVNQCNLSKEQLCNANQKLYNFAYPLMAVIQMLAIYNNDTSIVGQNISTQECLSQL